MRRVLFVSYTNFIKNTFSGGQKVSQKNYQMNVALFGSENVDVVIFDPDTEEKKDGNFVFIKSSPSKIFTFFNCLIGYARGYTRHCEDAIIKQIKENHYDYLYIDFSGYGVSMNKIKKVFSGKIITFFHDVEYMYELNRAKHDNILYHFSAMAIRNAEKKAIAYSDYIIALNNRDSKLIQKIYGREPDVVLPVSFMNAADKNMFVTEKDEGYLLFVGSDFGPNIDGLRFLVRNVMPKVSRKLKVIGKGMERYKAEMNGNNVEIIGTVDDLSKYYYGAAAAVLPIRYGDGMKVKTAEALMFGRTLIGTDEAFEGYEIKDGVEGYRCNTADEFIKAINNLEKTGYNPQSRKLFVEKYSLDSSIHAYKNLLFNVKEESGEN